MGRAQAADETECRLLCSADEACTGADYDEAAGECALRGAAEPPPAAPTARRRVLLVSYADGERFERTQQLLDESLGVAEIQEHWRWSAATFREPRHARWYARHQAANFRRGGAWKPYIIWQAFRRVRWGDWLVYHDASQYHEDGFSSSVQPLLEWLEQQRGDNPCECLAAMRMRQTLQHEWQQRCVPAYGPVAMEPSQAFDVFCGTLWRIGVCAPSDGVDCCRGVWRMPTHQHSWSVWRKNRHSARFLHDWMARAGDFETIAHLPFVDQSLNALLMYRWRLQLPIRALWAPLLYTIAWGSDLDYGSMGRNDGWILKHLNIVLAALASERAGGPQLLALVDPGGPGPPSPPHLATWSEASAPAAAWRESLCLGAGGGGRPALAARVFAAHLSVRLLGPGVLADEAMWSRRWKWPLAWPAAGAPLRPLPGDPPDAERAGLRAALAAQPGPLAAPGEFSLGTWRLPALQASLPQGDEAADLHAEVVADLFLVNTGGQPWPAGARLCAAGGNATPPLAFRAACLHPSAVDEGRACGEVPKDDLVRLQLVVLPPAASGADGRPAAGAAAHGRPHDAAWALCAADGSRAFGAVFRATVLLPA